jgi:ABC-2 type transport system ATP-binding protein
MIEVEGLTKVYGQFLAVNGLSFTVRPGEVLGLVGPNGAGKTTTLRCLSGIIPPSQGAVRLCGHDLAKDPVAAKRTLAWLPDEPRLFEYLTVWEHLVFSARIHQVQGFEGRAVELLSELELSEKRNALPGELSRGMCQKLSIACGFLHAPRVLVFDEPLTGLDPLGIRRMKDSILRRAREGAAVIISSHLLHLLEEVCSHVLILRRGELVTLGALADILARFRSEQPEASLEEIFLRVTGSGEGSGPCP